MSYSYNYTYNFDNVPTQQVYYQQEPTQQVYYQQERRLPVIEPVSMVEVSYPQNSFLYMEPKKVVQTSYSTINSERSRREPRVSVTRISRSPRASVTRITGSRKNIDEHLFEKELSRKSSRTSLDSHVSGNSRSHSRSSIRRSSVIHNVVNSPRRSQVIHNVVSSPRRSSIIFDNSPRRSSFVLNRAPSRSGSFIKETVTEYTYPPKVYETGYIVYPETHSMRRSDSYRSKSSSRSPRRSSRSSIRLESNQDFSNMINRQRIFDQNFDQVQSEINGTLQDLNKEIDDLIDKTKRQSREKLENAYNSRNNFSGVMEENDLNRSNVSHNERVETMYTPDYRTAEIKGIHEDQYYVFSDNRAPQKVTEIKDTSISVSGMDKHCGDCKDLIHHLEKKVAGKLHEGDVTPKCNSHIELQF